MKIGGKDVADISIDNKTLDLFGDIIALSEGTLTEITPAMLPGITKLRPYALAALVNVVSIELPDTLANATATSWSSCMASCSSLEKAVIPSGYIIPSYCFSGDSALITVDLGTAIARIYNNAFQNCSSLRRLILRRTNANDIVTGYVNAFNTLSADQFNVFVPDALVNTYKADSFWSSRTAHILPLSYLPQLFNKGDEITESNPNIYFRAPASEVTGVTGELLTINGWYNGDADPSSTPDEQRTLSLANNEGQPALWGEYGYQNIDDSGWTEFDAWGYWRSDPGFAKMTVASITALGDKYLTKSY